MAIDTRQKRMSAMNPGCPWRGPMVDATETAFSAGNRAAGAFMYSGVQADYSPPAVPYEPPSGSGQQSGNAIIYRSGPRNWRSIDREWQAPDQRPRERVRVNGLAQAVGPVIVPIRIGTAKGSGTANVQAEAGPAVGVVVGGPATATGAAVAVVERPVVYDWLGRLRVIDDMILQHGVERLAAIEDVAGEVREK